jgi:hypothetical protein
MKYLHLLGTLMYATKSRPDIKFATSLAATITFNLMQTRALKTSPYKQKEQMVAPQ